MGRREGKLGWLLLLLPLLLLGKPIVTLLSVVKDYYYPGEEANLSLRIISPSPSLLHIGIKGRVERAFLTHPTPFIYDLNLTFFVTKHLPVVEVDGVTQSATIPLKKFIKVHSLPKPVPATYTGVVADKLQIVDPEASYYDQNRSRIILSFNLQSVGGELVNFHLPATLTSDQNLTLITPTSAKFYAILPASIHRLKLYYFSPESEGYLPIEVPVDLKIDEVATQTNIKPETNLLSNPINVILLGAALIGFMAVLVYQRWWIFIFPIGFLAYFLYLNIPYKEGVLKPGAKVQILPTAQSTTFFIAKRPLKVKILGHYRHYIKIYFQNRVGWVKDGELQ